MSRALAREHGGELCLEAATGRGGAMFCLTLPVAEAVGPEHEPAALLHVDGEPAVVARVLVVDDEADLAGVMHEMLESAGYEVSVAESGEVALELLAAACFDAVVSDLRMPDMDGAELWRRVCERHPALVGRLLFVTGDTAHSREFSEEAYKLSGEPKELVIIRDAGHVDLYDRVELIPFDKLTSFFDTKLR